MSGRKIPHYEMTRDGLMVLTMGYTGAKAMAIKLRYIGAFNRMEAAIRAGVAVLDGDEKRTVAANDPMKSIGSLGRGGARTGAPISAIGTGHAGRDTAHQRGPLARGITGRGAD